MTLYNLSLIEEAAARKARTDFLTFRKLMNPRLKIGWFVEDITRELQKFGDDFLAGKRPKLIIQAPPQHGKSEAVTDFVAWISGRSPDTRSIYASFSERLGVRANLKMQRTVTRAMYNRIFPETTINNKNVVGVSGQYMRNKEILEYVGHEGFFRNTTVRGSITGESLDLGLIDDPLKGREEANSQNTRNKTWDWYTDDFSTRFSEDAALLMILTRWHVDDPAGRMIDKDDTIRVLKYEAIAARDEKHRKEGDPLFPEHKSLQFLNSIKMKMADSSWQSLYQQNPIVVGGNILKDNYWQWWKVAPRLTHKFITVDTAQKKNTWNDWTVAQCWGVDALKNIYLLDMIRIKEEAPEIRTALKVFYNKHDNKTIKDVAMRGMYIEDKSSGSSIIQDFKRDGMKIKDVQRNTDKISRALDVVPYIEAGRVYLNEDVPHVNEMLSEARGFPNAVHDDMLDPMMDAIEIGCVGSVNSLLAAMQAD